jgi:hypothetical protein
MVFNATFNNTSIISWRKPGEKHWQILSHNFVSSPPYHEWDSNSWLLVVISTDCIGSCNSNYHKIMTTTALLHEQNDLYGYCDLL